MLPVYDLIILDLEAAMRPDFITKNLYPLLPVVPKNASKDEEKNGLPKKSSRIENLDENIDYQLSTSDNYDNDDLMVEVHFDSD